MSPAAVNAVKDELVARLRAVLMVRPEVLEAYLFGSLARGEGSAHSDVDVAVYLTKEALGRSGFGAAAEIGSDLQATLGRPDVDLTVLNGAGPVLYHRVLRDGIRLFSRDPVATTTREGQALSRYCDYVPQLRKIEAAHRRRIDMDRFGR